MSTGEGSGSGPGTEFATMRGRDYPSIRQFTVFLENRVGQLLDVVRRFEGSHVRIVALTISDSTECALVRFLLSDPEAGPRDSRAGRPGARRIRPDRRRAARLAAAHAADLHRAARRRSKHHANLSAAIRPTGRPAVALMVDNIEIAIETLRMKGFHAINEDELKDT